jgi:toxin CcdB
MARFDVYATPMAEERERTPFWVDVQADHLSQLATRVVIPLVRLDAACRPAERLNPSFAVEGVRVFADIANLGTFPKRWLRAPVASLREERSALEDALDFLLTGH